MAILDWELSTIGDPLADFGYHCLLWHIGNIDDAAAKNLGIYTEAEYLDLYLKRTKMELESEWDFYIIFSKQNPIKFFTNPITYFTTWPPFCAPLYLKIGWQFLKK